MTRVIVFAEGQTEQKFLQLVQNHLLQYDVYLSTILSKTSPKGKGGLVNYVQIKNQIVIKCKEDPKAYCTTMFDLFRLPKFFPGKDKIEKINNPLEKAKLLEKEMEQDIGYDNFFANLTVYEFEGLLFSDPVKLAQKLDTKLTDEFVNIRKKFDTPEHINGSDHTAPSKRILNLYPTYKKIVNGISIAESIGLDEILKKCKHFKEWVDHLSSLGNNRSFKQLQVDQVTP